MLLAVAKYYSPGGKAIQDVSLTPAHPVADSIEADQGEGDELIPTPGAPGAPAPRPPDAPPGEDKILEKALEVLGAKPVPGSREAVKAEGPRLLPPIGQPGPARQ